MGGLGSCSLPNGAVPASLVGSRWTSRPTADFSSPCFPHHWGRTAGSRNQDSSANLERKRVTQHKHKSASQAQADFAFPINVFPSRSELLETLPWASWSDAQQLVQLIESHFLKFLLSFCFLISCAQASAPLSPMTLSGLCPAAAWLSPCQCIRTVSWLGQWVFQTQVLAAGVKCPSERRALFRGCKNDCCCLWSLWEAYLLVASCSHYKEHWVKLCLSASPPWCIPQPLNWLDTQHSAVRL